MEFLIGLVVFGVCTKVLVGYLAVVDTHLGL